MSGAARPEPPALRHSFPYQCGTLQGAIKAFLQGWGTREDLAARLAEVESWQEEARHPGRPHPCVLDPTHPTHVGPCAAYQPPTPEGAS